MNSQKIHQHSIGVNLTEQMLENMSKALNPFSVGGSDGHDEVG